MELSELVIKPVTTVAIDELVALYLQDVLVLPEHRRTGLGRALVQAILDHHGDGTLRAFVRFDG